MHPAPPLPASPASGRSGQIQRPHRLYLEYFRSQGGRGGTPHRSSRWSDTGGESLSRPTGGPPKGDRKARSARPPRREPVRQDRFLKDAANARIAFILNILDREGGGGYPTQIFPLVGHRESLSRPTGGPPKGIARHEVPAPRAGARPAGQVLEGCN